ncbi:MAG: hypothetical protein NDJ89_02275 [Oligoflexia bacterium]|nr:hypothetical protein [Oligoflexia bacterium]
MNLNYEKIRAKVEHGGNHWTSYSDLFLVLSVVFLLLYVVANLKGGAQSIISHTAMKHAKVEADDLRKQIKAYEAVRDGYLKDGASEDEVKVYQELMGKLSLLEDQAKEKRRELNRQAREAGEREQDLNQYQALVKNIISANLVAQARVKKRDNVIEEKQAEIVQKEQELGNLNANIAQKQAEIESNNRKISEIESNLAQQIEEVQRAYKSKQSSEKKMQEAIAQLRSDSESRIQGLRSENSSYAQQLQTAQSEIEQKNRETERLLGDLNQKEAKYRDTVAELQRAHQETMAREKSAFEKGLARAQLSADAKLAQERAYRADVERRNKAYNDQLAALDGELQRTRGSIKAIEGKYHESINSLKNANDTLQRNLTASNNKLNEQRRLAEGIKNAFAKAGIDANVDLKTGDVMINFANEYFDTGRADLKTGMRSTLEKTIPTYAKSLFQDPKIASRIGSVEIVGFASPTYQGRYIDPDSLSPEDRTAVNFNMDLSYQRAKAIFEHVFDTQKMQFQHQKDLLPLVKVSGRSYLATERLQGRDVAQVKDGNYCKVFDCKKGQRVIIKFNLRDE